MTIPVAPNSDLGQLTSKIRIIAREQGFDDMRVTDCDLSESAPRLQEWLDKGYAGDMDYIGNRF